MTGHKITPALKKQFAEFMTGHLNEFERILLAFEKTPGDRKVLDKEFRTVHNIKGGSDYNRFLMYCNRT